MASVQLTPLKQTLTRILLQTIESLADSQWELRRITKQVIIDTPPQQSMHAIPVILFTS